MPQHAPKAASAPDTRAPNLEDAPAAAERSGPSQSK